MATKRWKKTAPKKCTKKEEKETLEHLRRIGQYKAWLQTLEPTESVLKQLERSEIARQHWQARYKALITK